MFNRKLKARIAELELRIHDQDKILNVLAQAMKANAELLKRAADIMADLEKRIKNLENDISEQECLEDELDRQGGTISDE